MITPMKCMKSVTIIILVSMFNIGVLTSTLSAYDKEQKNYCKKNMLTTFITKKEIKENLGEPDFESGLVWEYYYEEDVLVFNEFKKSNHILKIVFYGENKNNPIQKVSHKIIFDGEIKQSSYYDVQEKICFISIASQGKDQDAKERVQ